MTRAWIGTALLAASWLLSLGYFQPANYLAWFCALAAATVLLSDLSICWPDRRHGVAAILLLLPTAWLMPLPYKAIPVLLAAGLIVQISPVARLWPRKLGQGAVAAGAILLAQFLVLHAYSILTARSHELPWPLAKLVGAVPQLLGIDAAADGSVVATHGLGETRRFAATWELVVDPATLCFFVGGLIVLGLSYGGVSNGDDRWRRWLRSAGVFLAVTLAWVPFRVALVMAIVFHRALRADAITIPNVADVLVSSWIHILLLAGPVFMAIRLIGKPSAQDEGGQPENDEPTTSASQRWSRLSAPLLIGVGVAILTVLLHWDPVGRLKNGRIMFVERHSTWEPTTEPYGTTVYGEAGSYNYAGIFEYCGQYYEMLRLLQHEEINNETLDRCDVLVIKTPTSRYSTNEVAAVVRFVQRGGSLLMIGDHTNVFNMNTYLNDVSRHFGFTFRNDLLFRVGSPYVQEYRPPLVAHPIVQDVPPMNFAVSCSIDPGTSIGRMAIRNSGLYNLPPAYQEMNYHPQAEYRHDMQYGAWCQMWATRHGKGRVVAFADSTLFSNFCVFQPGKTDLFLGMINWLNRASVFDVLWVRLLVVLPFGLAGLVLLNSGLRQGWRRNASWLVMAAAGLAGWTAGSLAIIIYGDLAMPPPVVDRPMTHVVIDRTLSEVPLHTGAFPDDKDGLGYGLLEQWIPRIGNYISRQSGADAFTGDALVIVSPTRSVSKDYRDRLVQFVETGGHVLVFDAIDLEGSTANSLLWPFGLASSHATQPIEQGEVRLAGSDLKTPLDVSCQITGGEPIAWLGDMPIAARVRHGDGTVTAVGCGALFNDMNMGTSWLVPPDDDMRNRYEVLYALLRAALPTGS